MSGTTGKPVLRPASRAVDAGQIPEPEAEQPRRQQVAQAIEPGLPPPSIISAPRVTEPAGIPPAEAGVRAARGGAVRGAAPRGPLAAEVARRLAVTVPSAIAGDYNATARHLFDEHGATIQNELRAFERRDRAPRLSTAQRMELVLAWAAQAARDRQNVGERDGVTRYDTRSALLAMLVVAHNSRDARISERARTFAAFAAAQLEQELVDGGLSRDEARRYVQRTAGLASASASGWQQTHRSAAQSAWFREAVSAAEAKAAAEAVTGPAAPTDTARAPATSDEIAGGGRVARAGRELEEDLQRKEAARQQIEQNLGQRRIANLESQGKPVGGTPDSMA